MNCRVPGCETKLVSPNLMGAHERKPHVRCGCSWVGLAQSWRLHKNLTKRHGLLGCVSSEPVQAFLPR
jgi:hypothetical protein